MKRISTIANVHYPLSIDRAALRQENAARIASAMQPTRQSTGWLAVQLFCRFRDHAALIARAGKFVIGRLAAAVAAGDRGRAIGRAAGDVIELPLACKPVIQADNG